MQGKIKLRALLLPYMGGLQVDIYCGNTVLKSHEFDDRDVHLTPDPSVFFWKMADTLVLGSGMKIEHVARLLVADPVVRRLLVPAPPKPVLKVVPPPPKEPAIRREVEPTSGWEGLLHGLGHALFRSADGRLGALGED